MKKVLTVLTLIILFINLAQAERVRFFTSSNLVINCANSESISTAIEKAVEINKEETHHEVLGEAQFTENIIVDKYQISEQEHRVCVMSKLGPR